MNFFNELSKRKLMIISILLVIMILSLGKFYLNNKINNAFIELSEKNITKILIRKSSFWINDEYAISDKERIESILDYLIKLEKDYTPVTESTSWTGRFDYSLSCEDDHSPPHYTHVYVRGNKYIDLRIYNYTDKKYDQYRAKINLDEDEIEQLLSEEN